MTRGEKILLFLLILSLLALILLGVFVSLLFINSKNVCESPTCIVAVAKLLETLDFSKDPCSNFHEFICNNIIPKNKETFEFYVENKKLGILTSIKESNDTDLEAAKTFYNVCTNDSFEHQDVFLAHLIDKLGGWPLLLHSIWNDTNFHWQQFMAQVRPYGIMNEWLVKLDYFQDTDGTNLLLIRPPDFRLKLSDESLKLVFYEELIHQLSLQLGASEVVSTREIKEMIEFEDELRRIRKNVKKKPQKGSNYTRIRVSSLNEVWPNINLIEILNELSRGFSVFTNSTIVVIESETYIYQLHNLLVRTSNRTQVNYFVWKTLEAFLGFSTGDIRDIYGKYVELPSRQAFCFNEAIKRFYSTIEKTYLVKYKENETIQALNRMANLIQDSTNVVVSGFDAPHSGFTAIEFRSTNIIGMINEIQFKAYNEFFKCIHQPADSCLAESYHHSAQNTEEDVSYETDENTIYLPYSLAYSDVYKWDQPNYINYARMGQLIVRAIKEVSLYSDRSHDIVMAYQAYQQWVQMEGVEDKLPVLNYTENQLFWIHSANGLCSTDSTEHTFKLIESSSEFQKDFVCHLA